MTPAKVQEDQGCEERTTTCVASKVEMLHSSGCSSPKHANDQHARLKRERNHPGTVEWIPDRGFAFGESNTMCREYENRCKKIDLEVVKLKAPNSTCYILCDGLSCLTYVMLACDVCSSFFELKMNYDCYNLD